VPLRDKVTRKVALNFLEEVCRAWRGMHLDPARSWSIRRTRKAAHLYSTVQHQMWSGSCSMPRQMFFIEMKGTGTSA
jgi:hypothetical protein